MGLVNISHYTYCKGEIILAMNKNSMYIIPLLALIWCILAESFSAFHITVGLLLSVTSVYFCTKTLNLNEVIGFSFARLALYPFFLVYQVYLAGFHVARLVFSGARADIVTVESSLKNSSLRVLLAHSITLTPGSISIGLRGNTITALLIREKDAPPLTKETSVAAVSAALEGYLARAD